jgi:uncharacterized protein (TIGR03437 family)
MMTKISHRVFVLALLLPGFAIAAAPAIQSVTDSAVFGPRIAPGSLASVFGSGLATDTSQAGSFPLPTNLGGTTLSVGGILAPLLYASPTQINFQVPASTPAGSAKVVVNGPGGASASFSVTVTAQAPSIFQYGTNRALAQNADGTLNSATAPAAAGSYITVYLTGQGAVDNSVSDGAATPLSPLSTATAKATATIGPMNATVQFLGLTPDFAGLAQANIQVPTLPSGDYPLVITAGGYVSASAVISVSGSGTVYKSLLTMTSSAAFPNSTTSNVVLYNNIAYVCGSSRIEMVDLSNVNSPSVIGEFGDSVLNGNGDRCALNTNGSVPFLVDIIGQDTGSMESFAVFNLTNPRSPSLLTVASTTYGHMEDLSFSGMYGIVTTSYITYSNSTLQITAQQGDFLVFDFTNPAQPIFLTYLPPSSIQGSGNQNLKPYAEVVNSSYAYVASSTASGTSTSGQGFIDVINITLPTAPTPVSLVTVPQAAILMSFDISGNTLLAAGNTTGQRNPGKPDFDFTGYLTLATMDLTNVQLPAVVSTITTQIQTNGTFNTIAFGSSGVFAIVNKPPTTDDYGPSALMIVDARTQASIALYPFSTQFGFNGLLTTNNGYLLAPTSTGLNIYQLQL